MGVGVVVVVGVVDVGVVDDVGAGGVAAPPLVAVGSTAG